MALVSDRLRNHHLVAADRSAPSDLVARLGALQAQDFSAAKWAIGVRVPQSHDADVEQAFNDGAILRTHVLRPTWHFVAAADIRWMLALSAPRVHAANAYYYRLFGLDAKTLSRSCAIVHRALEGGRALTRAELGRHLTRAKVPAEGLRLAYIMMHAELEGAVTSGPRRGRQFTYMRLDERAPGAATLERRDGAVALAARYFASRGPATLRDFVWWSGLTSTDAQAALEGVAPALHREVLGGRVHFSVPPPARRAGRGASAFLLPNYDEYIIAYKDRDAVVDASRAANIVARSNGASPHYLVIGGRLAGSWARTLRGNGVLIDVAPYRTLTPAEARAVAAAAECYAEFLGLPATVRTV